MIDFSFSLLAKYLPKYSHPFLWIGNFFERKFRIFDNRLTRTFIQSHNIPFMNLRLGGGHSSYADWCFQSGVYASLLAAEVEKHGGVRILDVGCGVGSIVPGILQVISKDSTYLGVDIDQEMIGQCKKVFKDPRVKFSIISDTSTFYKANKLNAQTISNICKQKGFDVIIAKALFDHLTPKLIKSYLHIFRRALSEDGLIIATFFLIDYSYQKQKRNINKRFHFDDGYIGEKGFKYSAKHNRIPEAQLAVEDWRLKEFLDQENLIVSGLLKGTWRDDANHSGVDMPDTLFISHKDKQLNV